MPERDPRSHSPLLSERECVPDRAGVGDRPARLDADERRNKQPSRALTVERRRTVTEKGATSEKKRPARTGENPMPFQSLDPERFSNPNQGPGVRRDGSGREPSSDAGPLRRSHKVTRVNDRPLDMAAGSERHGDVTRPVHSFRRPALRKIERRECTRRGAAIERWRIGFGGHARRDGRGAVGRGCGR